jgi:hypothetical protein
LPSAALAATATAATQPGSQIGQLGGLLLRNGELAITKDLAQGGELLLERAALGLEQLVAADRAEELLLPIALDLADNAIMAGGLNRVLRGFKSDFYCRKIMQRP